MLNDLEFGFFSTNPKISITERKKLAIGDRLYEENMNRVRKTEKPKKLRFYLIYDVLSGVDEEK